MSGAYVYPVDNLAVIPLVPPQGYGDVKFGRVWLSFSFDDFGLPVQFPPPGVRVRITDDTGSQRVNETIQLAVGRSAAIECLSGDMCASAMLLYHTGDQTPSVTAMVEYQTPSDPA